MSELNSFIDKILSLKSDKKLVLVAVDGDIKEKLREYVRELLNEKK